MDLCVLFWPFESIVSHLGQLGHCLFSFLIQEIFTEVSYAKLCIIQMIYAVSVSDIFLLFVRASSTLGGA